MSVRGLLGLIVFAVTWTGTEATAGETSKQQLVNLLETSVRAIRTYEVYVENRAEVAITLESVSTLEPGKPRAFRTVVLAKPQTSVQRSRQVYDSGKYRVEPLHIPGKPKDVDVIVSNGEIERTYDAQRREANIRQPTLQPLPYGEFYQELFRSILGSRAIAEVLRERSNVRVFTHADGRRVVAETDPCPMENVTGNGFGFRFVFDPDVGMLPVSVEMFQNRDQRQVVWHRLTVTRFRMLDSGVSVPIQAKTDFFWTRNDSNLGQIQSWQETVVDVTRSSWNKPIDAREFIVPLPAGVRVTDMNRQVTYTTGKPDPGTNLDDLAKDAKRVLHHSPTLVKQAVSHWIWWSAGGVLTATILVFLLYIRRGA